MSAVAEELGPASGRPPGPSAAEADRLDRQREQAAELARDQHRSTLSELQDRLFAVESEDAPEEVDPAARDALAELTSFARQREVEARLVQRTAEERARATAGNAGSLRRQARQERQHRLRVGRGRSQAHRQFSGRHQGRRGRPSGRAAAGDRRWPTPPPSGTGRPPSRAGADAALTAARARAAELQKQWDRLTDAVHSGEVLRAQQTLQAEQLADEVDRGVRRPGR